MAWEECVASIKSAYNGKAVQEIPNVNWSTISQDDLDNDNFKDGNPFFLICPDRHCVESVNQTPADHALCQCKDINGNPIANCTAPSALYPEKASVCLNVSDPTQFNAKSGRACINQTGGDWYPLTCYCCCSCFANGMRIGIPNGLKAIEHFRVGEKVLTAQVKPHGVGVQLQWKAAKVKFSSGTGPDGHQSAMVHIHHGVNGTIIVTPDHLFLMPNGKLKRADRLVPGKDQLVSAEGLPVTIHEVSVGEYHGGVHHIATNNEFNGTLDGHLLISEGVVSGDFTLQMNARSLKDRYFDVDHDKLPKIGTSTYESANTHLQSGNYVAFKASANTVTPPNPQKFYVHGERVTAIPDNAAQFFSDAQERELSKNADMQNFTEVGISNAMIQYVLKLFQGFYPNLVFYHDVGRLEANAYAFEQYGKQIIVLSGGLTRINGFSQEGIALVLAHMIVRLQKIAPLGVGGYSSVAMADYYASVILRNVYFGDAYTRAFGEGLKQVKTYLFAKITSANDAYAGDPYAPTMETRLDAFSAGDSMQFPPDGTGGPVQGALKVGSATVLPNPLSAASFVTEDISADVSAQVFADLQKNNVLDSQGVVAASFTVDTDLSFLFANQQDGLKTLLISEVRYALLHAGAKIKVGFSDELNPDLALDVSHYELSPEASVHSAELLKSEPVVVLTVSLTRGVDYTLTVSPLLRSSNGSTLDPDSDSVSFKWV